MPVHRQRQILRPHPCAVVADANEPAPALLNGHINPARARIKRVLDQLLYGGRGTLHHLASGDAVNQHRIKTANLQGGGSRISMHYALNLHPARPRALFCAKLKRRARSRWVLRGPRPEMIRPLTSG